MRGDRDGADNGGGPRGCGHAKEARANDWNMRGTQEEEGERTSIRYGHRSPTLQNGWQGTMIVRLETDELGMSQRDDSCLIERSLER